ncbi:MAG: ABC transporter ATP-binding protein [Nitrososphaerota archaeon]|jgi:peptide/nickel transport system ATP-binding protein|nr:ABC transporter ATP-binding protein [Nitrososphaerota archaeon]
MPSATSVLSVRDLHVTFSTPRGPLYAVQGISFDLGEGETMGLVGESGSGKSTLALGILRLLPLNGKWTAKSISVMGQDVVSMSERDLNSAIRWTKLAYVPQASQNALDPLYRVGDQFVETVAAHAKVERDGVLKKAGTLLEQVGVDPAKLQSYPWELSGGQKQRVMIAMALILEPKIVILDEPTTALDTIIQAQILELFKQMRSFQKLSSMFISHDISVISNIADRVGVMYAGSLVEMASVSDIFKNPIHPYTQGLRESVPDVRKNKPISFIPGTPPDLVNPPPGCRFHPRCPYVQEVCKKSDPPLLPYPGDHYAACHFAERWVKQ